MTQGRQRAVLIGRHEGLDHEFPGSKGARHLSCERCSVHFGAGTGSEHAIDLCVIAGRRRERSEQHDASTEGRHHRDEPPGKPRGSNWYRRWHWLMRSTG